MTEHDWYGCYSEGWTGLIVPDAFAHPAKFARGLIRRIYEHAFEQGWFQVGDAIVDPFAGVAMGALHAMQRGLDWWGVELEEKFVSLGNDNIALWAGTYAAHMPGWGTAHLLQGDSRELARVLGRGMGGSVSSPPYPQAQEGGGIALSGTPAQVHECPGGSVAPSAPMGYGHTPSNLGNLRASDADHAAAVAGVVSSPPYAQIRPEKSSTGVDLTKQYETYRAQGGGASFEKFRTTQELHSQGYGSSPGQLAAMQEGSFGGAVSSPPYEQSVDRWGKQPNDMMVDKSLHARYGDTTGQLGLEQGDTFWTAARTIMEQLHATLSPGAHAIWIVKSFVRNKQRVDFPGQWRELGEACGFATVEWIRAWLVEDRGAQWMLNGDLDERQVERKSFFRRLAERKGSPRIDYEVVLVQRKVT